MNNKGNRLKLILNIVQISFSTLAILFGALIFPIFLRNAEMTKATISEIVTTETSAYYLVDYKANNHQYLNKEYIYNFDSNAKVGDQIDIYYNRWNESEIVRGDTTYIISIILIVAGTADIMALIFINRKEKKVLEDSSACTDEAFKTESAELEKVLISTEENSKTPQNSTIFEKFYFKPRDLFTNNYVIEDENKNVVYEIFTDNQFMNTTKNYIFKSLVRDYFREIKVGPMCEMIVEEKKTKKYFCTIDGDVCWEVIKDNGIWIEEDRDAKGYRTFIYKFGKKICTIENANSLNIYEENKMSKLQLLGYYRLKCDAEYFDDIMLAVFLIAYTGNFV